jgi:hypothetical protein
MTAVPTEAQIIEALQKVSATGVYTWVLTGQFRDRGYAINTDWMRSRLSTLERHGKVKRLSSRIASQIVWRAA